MLAFQDDAATHVLAAAEEGLSLAREVEGPFAPG
jgi:hypothetical protein